MATSVPTPVDCKLPCVNIVSIEATITPKPTSLGFTPPTSTVGFAAPDICCEIIS